MAGKHTTTGYGSGFPNPGLENVQSSQRPVFPGSKEDRAYAEGRLDGSFGAGPHPAGTPERIAWDSGAFYSGNPACQIQTADE